ncbi:MAG: hypothetical protein K0S04_3586 [Herbinix sp.]|nr:hypothetical protein [Herbinix sp.]
MRKFVGSISTNVVGSECEFEFEVEDNATEEEIEEAGKQAAFEYVDWGYNEELNKI